MGFLRVCKQSLTNGYIKFVSVYNFEAKNSRRTEMCLFEKFYPGRIRFNLAERTRCRGNPRFLGENSCFCRRKCRYWVVVLKRCDYEKYVYCSLSCLVFRY